MSTPVETTLEEASRCPKCEFPGMFEKERLAPNAITKGAKLRFYVCMNERCRWYKTTCCVVQVNPDGSIPPPTLKHDKKYPAVPDLTREVNENLERQLAAETAGDAEIRGGR